MLLSLTKAEKMFLANLLKTQNNKDAFQQAMAETILQKINSAR